MYLKAGKDINFEDTGYKNTSGCDELLVALEGNQPAETFGELRAEKMEWVFIL